MYSTPHALHGSLVGWKFHSGIIDFFSPKVTAVLRGEKKLFCIYFFFSVSITFLSSFNLKY